jgi:hypothetical protein
MFFNPQSELNTVRACNFQSHGNFGPFLASSIVSVDELCTKNEQNRIYEQFSVTFIFSFFFVGRALKLASFLEKTAKST